MRNNRCDGYEGEESDGWAATMKERNMVASKDRRIATMVRTTTTTTMDSKKRGGFDGEERTKNDEDEPEGRRTMKKNEEDVEGTERRRTGERKQRRRWRKERKNRLFGREMGILGLGKDFCPCSAQRLINVMFLDWLSK